MLKPLSLLIALTLILSASIALAEEAKGQWVPLFNGKNLDGWTPKFVREDLGVNYNDTFVVEDGLLKAKYDKWTKFENKYGHLYYKDKFSNYRIRAEYRFVGEQCPGGPGWALRNNGLMLHCQDPKTIRKDQDFPVSIEVQLLGGLGKGARPTANVCSPGTHYEQEGKLVTAHCKNSTSKTFNGDQWVTVEIEVRGSKSIKHYVNGELVFDYSKPQLDEKDGDAKRLLAAGAPKLIEGGWISIQAESHPTEFRKIEIMQLAD